MISRRKRLAAVSLALLVFTGFAAAEYVGTAPGSKSLGTVERGETIETRFYVVTDQSSPFTVKPSVIRVNSALLEGEGTEGFKPEEASQEDVTGWVDLTQDSYVVEPGDTKVVPLENGGVAQVSGEVEFDLHIPEDAEPGYHAVAVNLNPRFSQSDASGAQLQTMGLTQFRLFFRVPGEAVRDVKVLEVNSIRRGDDYARLDYLLKNNGTVTVRVNRFQTSVYSQFGNQTGTISSGGTYIKPGNTKVVQNHWRSPIVEGGEFRVRGELDYMTGSSILDSTINISEFIEVEDSDDQAADGVPWWLVLMALVVVGALMFYFEIDPVLIVAVLGIGAISAVVLAAGLPLYIVPLVIIMTVVILYYGR